MAAAEPRPDDLVGLLRRLAAASLPDEPSPVLRRPTCHLGAGRPVVLPPRRELATEDPVPVHRHGVSLAEPVR